MAGTTARLDIALGRSAGKISEMNFELLSSERMSWTRWSCGRRERYRCLSSAVAVGCWVGIVSEKGDENGYARNEEETRTFCSSTF